MIFSINPPSADAPQTGQTQEVFDANASGTLGYLAEFVSSWNSNVNLFNNDVSSINTKYTDIVNRHIDIATATNDVLNAKEHIDNIVIPTEAVDSQIIRDKKDKLLNEVKFNASGYTRDVAKKDRWLETDIPNTIVDKVSEPIYIDGKLVERASLVASYRARGTQVNSYSYEWERGVILDIKVGNAVSIVFEGKAIVSGIISSIGDGYAFLITQDRYDRVEGVYYELVLLKQAVLPEAPFSPTSTDELLDDKLFGVTTQENHSKGDIVVTGNELSDLVTVSFNNTSGATEYIQIIDNETLIVGKEYFIYGYVSKTNGTTGFTNNGISGSARRDTVGAISESFIATEDILRTFSTDGVSSTIENITVTSSDTIHQATTDTLAGDLLTDTTKFQVLEDVTRQDIVLIAQDGRYLTVKGLHTFGKDVYADMVASKRGWSKTDNNTYSVSNLVVTNDEGITEIYTGKVIYVGLSQRLNSGAYHPIFNSFGVNSSNRSVSGTSYWYRDDCIPHNSVYTTCRFVNYDNLTDAGADDMYINTLRTGFIEANGIRPDDKLGDKLYFKGDGGLVFQPSYSMRNGLDLDVEASKLLTTDDMEIDCGVEIKYSKVSEITTGLWANYSGWVFDGYYFQKINIFVTELLNVDIDTIIDYGKISAISIGKNGVERLYVRQVGRTGTSSQAFSCWDGRFTLNSDDLESIIVFSIEGSSTLTQGESTTIDLIGDPSQYISTDATYTVPTTVSITDMSTNTLVWDEVTGLMHKALVATNDIDANGVPIPAFTDTASWEEVQKGYPQDWLNHLSSGKKINANALLVGENGEDYIPDGGYIDIKASKKVVKGFDALRASSAVGAFYTDANISYSNYISNSTGTFLQPLSRIIIESYISKNKPLVQSEPLPIELVQPKMIVSNSHSIYKGAMVTNSVTSKVAVGNGTRGLESKVLENCELWSIINQSDGMLHYGIAVSRIFYADTTDNKFYKFIGGTIDAVYDFSTYDFSLSTAWEETSTIQTTSEHSTLSIDNVVSPTSKVFTSLGVDSNDEYCLVVNGEEMIADGTTNGDDGTFDNLTNGTFIDLNGNTCRSYVGIKRLGYFKGDK